MINKTNLTIAIFLALALSASCVYAFGIAASNGPFTISPGETKTAYLWLQNLVGTEDITVKAEIKEGSEIASITGSNQYLVKLGTDNTEVPVKIQIPSDTALNTTYRVGIAFLTVTPGSSTGVAFGTGIEKSITVLVVAEEEGKGVSISTTTIIIGIAVIILVIIIILVLLRKKKAR